MGILYLVSTPIGNLEDVSARGLRILREADYVICEDTRVTGKLLSHFEILQKMTAVNDFNEEGRVGGIIDDLVSGLNLAMVSDSGTPLVSDPGYKIVRGAIEAGVRVEAIPGPSAVITSLIVSGKPPDKFLFLGYLPRKEGKRKDMLEKTRSIVLIMKMSVVFYESPFRLLRALGDLGQVFGDIDIAVCRELTKMHEEVRREKVSGAIAHFSKIHPKGEFTIVL